MFNLEGISELALQPAICILDIPRAMPWAVIRKAFSLLEQAIALY